MQIFFHSCLWSYLPRVPILVEDTVYIFVLEKKRLKKISEKRSRLTCCVELSQKSVDAL